jgi:hypothetical protein
MRFYHFTTFYRHHRRQRRGIVLACWLALVG